MASEKPRKPTVLDLLTQAGAFADSGPRGRGRPRFVTAGDHSRSLAYRWAEDVAKERHRMGGLRGSQAAAIAKVARRQPEYSRALKSAIESRIKQAVKRYPDARSMGRMIARFSDAGAELERRMLGFPDDVKAMTDHWPGARLLAYLRANDIDGTCPAELIELARRRSE